MRRFDCRAVRCDDLRSFTHRVCCFVHVLPAWFLRSAISTNKAAILKAVGAKNEAAATQLVADLDLGLGKPTALARSDAFVGEGETRWLKSQRRRCSLAGDGGAGAGRAGVDVPLSLLCPAY